MHDSKIRIANLQIWTAFIGTIIAYGHFVYVGLSFRASGRDTWFSLMIGFLVGGVILFIHTTLASRYPNESLILFTKRVFGRWISAPINLLYISFFLFIGSLTMKELISFLGIMFPETPHQIFLLMEFVLVAWVIRAGGESVSRAIQLLLPLLILLGSLSMIFSMKDKVITRLLPILHRDVFSISHGALLFAVMFAEMIVMNLFYQDANHVKKLPKQGMILTGILFVMYLGPVTGPILVFGESLAKILPYPTFSEIRFIRLGGIFERMDIAGVLLWTMGSYIRISVFLLGASRGIAQMVSAKGESDFALPIAFLGAGIVLSFTSISREELHQYLYTTHLFIVLFVGVFLPLLTLVVSYFRRQKNMQV